MTSAPSVSAEPPKSRDKQPDSTRGSGNKRRGSSGSKGNKRDSRELNEIPIKVDNTGEITVKMAPKASVESIDLDSSKESLTGHAKIPIKPLRSDTSVTQKPKLKEIARQSSKEVIRYTEVEQKQTYVESGPEGVQTMSETVVVETPVREASTIVDEHGISRKGSDAHPSIIPIISSLLSLTITSYLNSQCTSSILNILQSCFAVHLP